MRHKSIWIHVFLPICLCLFLLNGCAPLISPFDQVAYEQATSLKVEALALMDKATESYSEHEKDANRLSLEAEKAHEYAKGRPKNEISAKQWELLIDPEKNLLGGFLKHWKEKGKLSATFIREAKALVAEAFNLIIWVEGGKIKRSDIK